MKKILELDLFNDFWIDCQSKNMLSVLLTHNKTYRAAAAMNSYTYGVGGRSGWYKSLTVDYDKEQRGFFSNVLRSKYDFAVGCDYIDELKSRLNEGRLISVRVDLYYWNPLNVLYHNIHRNHFAMCFGYDDDEQCLYFDDEMENEYGYLKISYDEFRQAAFLENGKLFGIELKLRPDIADYTYSLGEVIQNALKIKKSIMETLCTSPWGDFGRTDDNSMQMTDMSKVYYRQTANVCLFECLKNNGYISEEQFLSYKERFKAVELIWRSLHNIMYKSVLKKRGVNALKACEYSVKALTAEYEVWDTFIKENGFQQQINVPQMQFDVVSDYVPTIIGSRLNSNEYDKLSDIGIESICTELNTADEYTSIILIKYNNVCGKLRSIGDGGKWSLVSTSTAFTGELIDKTEISGNSVIIYSQMPWKDVALKKYFRLSYSQDKDNAIVDDNGSAVPSLRDMSMEERVCISPFITRIAVSNPVLLDDMSDVDYPKLRDSLTWSKTVTDNYMFSFPENACTSQSDVGVFYRFFLDSKQAEPMYLHFGYVDAQLLWLNSQPLAEFPAREVHYCSYDKRIPIMLKEGRNEIAVFNRSLKGEAERISFRMESCCDYTEFKNDEWMPTLIVE